MCCSVFDLGKLSLGSANMVEKKKKEKKKKRKKGKMTRHQLKVTRLC
jgi:hypothetical protein